jgi:hypothetical protein
LLDKVDRVPTDEGTNLRYQICFGAQGKADRTQHQRNRAVTEVLLISFISRAISRRTHDGRRSYTSHRQPWMYCIWEQFLHFQMDELLALIIIQITCISHVTYMYLLTKYSSTVPEKLESSPFPQRFNSPLACHHSALNIEVFLELHPALIVV